jgi:mono/diheme cytochrome c family protein
METTSLRNAHRVDPALSRRWSPRVERPFLLPSECVTRYRSLVLAVFAFITTDVASAADVEHGEKIARRWCASCHVISPHQQGSVIEAPPFATIAQKPDFDAAKLAQFLLDPHPKMPNMELSKTETADLAAFIATLK